MNDSRVGSPLRVLVVASHVPSHYTGAEIRLLYLLSHLSRWHDVTLMALNGRGAPEEEVAALLPRCRVELLDTRLLPRRWPPTILRESKWYWRAHRICAALLQPSPAEVRTFHYREFQTRLDDRLARETYDLIHVNELFMWPYMRRVTGTPTVLCNTNAWASFSDRVSRKAAKPSHRLWSRFEARKMRRLEKAAVEAADHCVAVSAIDREFIRQLVPTACISVVPNGVDTSYFAASDVRPVAPQLVFTATMNYGPNPEAMLLFCRDMWPSLVSEFPDLRLSIVGMNPPPEVVALARDPRIRVTGFVPDVRPFIAEATVYIVPLRLGSGTRLKILEALAMGKAVVSTSLGAEGLNLVHGEHLLIADGAEQFVDSVGRLLRDQALRTRLGNQGRVFVQAHYDWEKIAAGLSDVYLSVARAGHAASSRRLIE